MKKESLFEEAVKIKNKGQEFSPLPSLNSIPAPVFHGSLPKGQDSKEKLGFPHPPSPHHRQSEQKEAPGA
jgi:hypothetical protein